MIASQATESTGSQSTEMASSAGKSTRETVNNQKTFNSTVLSAVMVVVWWWRWLFVVIVVNQYLDLNVLSTARNPLRMIESHSKKYFYLFDTQVVKPQAKRWLTTLDTPVNSKQNQIETVNHKQISVFTLHLSTTDRSVFKQVLCTDLIDTKTFDQNSGMCLIRCYHSQLNCHVLEPIYYPLVFSTGTRFSHL